MLIGAALTFSGWPAAADEGWRFAAHLRERASFFSANTFDRNAVAADWVWTQRALLGVDYQGDSGMTGRLGILSALHGGGPANRVNRNALDVQEAWLQFGDVSGGVRLGRQELLLGSQRLVGTREGTNVWRTWDGARLMFGAGAWQVDALAVQLVDVAPNGAFNDEPDAGRSLAGVYATRSAGFTELDLYYLYARFDERTTIEGTANQERHSVGLRVFGDAGPWFWNWEAIAQLGRHGSDDIEAWTLATNTGYRFDAHWSPTLMLSVNMASGDAESGDGKLQTFDALYPRGNYFSELALLGPQNFFNVNPDITVSPVAGLELSLDVNWYWRLETADGIYGPPGNLLRAPGDSDERFVNTAASLTVEWQARDDLYFGLSLTHSRPERFVEQTGPSDIVNFAEFTITVGF